MPPELVICLRHGEKPANAEDHSLSDAGDPGLNSAGEVSPRSLTAQGWARAWALAATGLCGQLSDQAAGGNVSLMVPKYAEATGEHRPFLTMLPLSRRLRVEPLTPSDRDDVDALLTAVTDRHDAVVVCWEHDRLADFVSRLLDAPKSWPDTVEGHARYDVLWVIRPAAGNTFQQYDQRFGFLNSPAAE